MAASAQQIVSRWQAAMQSGAARQKYIDGINNFQGNPMALAADPAALARYAQNTAAAAQPGGKMATKLMAANVNTWKANAIGPGATNLMTGAQKGLAKVTASAAKVAAAGQAAHDAAKGVQGAMAKVAAAINAVRAAHGYSPIA